MYLSTLLILLERYGMAIKDTRLGYEEIYGEWDIPIGFILKLYDSTTEINLEGRYELPMIEKRKGLSSIGMLFTNLGSNNRYISIPTRIVIKSNNEVVQAISYSDFLETIV